MRSLNIIECEQVAGGEFSSTHIAPLAVIGGAVGMYVGAFGGLYYASTSSAMLWSGNAFLDTIIAVSGITGCAASGAFLGAASLLLTLDIIGECIGFTYDVAFRH